MTHNVALTHDDIANLPSLSLQISKLCVWATLNDTIEQGQRLLMKQNVDMDEILIREVGAFFIKQWQVLAPRVSDDTRVGRTHCFLCSRKLPQVEGQLCLCYKEARQATYISDLHSLADVLEYKKQAPRTYRQALVSTHLCSTPDCGQLFKVTLGHVEDTLRKLEKFDNPRPYSPPRLCPDCFHEMNVRKWEKEKMEHERALMAHAQQTRPKLLDRPRHQRALEKVTAALGASTSASHGQGGVHETVNAENPALCGPEKDGYVVLAGGVDPNDTMVRRKAKPADAVSAGAAPDTVPLQAQPQEDRRRGRKRYRQEKRKDRHGQSETPTLDAAVASAVLSEGAGPSDLSDAPSASPNATDLESGSDQALPQEEPGADMELKAASA